MEPRDNESNAKPTAPTIWYLWHVYTLRFVIFSVIGSFLQPVVEDLDEFWIQKLYQALSGVPFGLVCGIVFTPLQNVFNTPRIRGKTWLIVIGTWTSIKFVVVGIFVALDVY